MLLIIQRENNSQWAAVKTVVGFIKVPPQRAVFKFLHLWQHCTKVCAGQLCWTASVPPIILDAGFGLKNLRPHS
jgi:hypothetical protein